MNTAVTASETATPPCNETINGHVIEINSNGNLIVINPSTGEIYVIIAAGLQLHINVGDAVSFVVIITPNGRKITHLIGH